MSRPGEQELVAKGVIKATRNSMSPTTISFWHPTTLTIFSPSSSVPVFGVPLPHVMYITYTQFQLPLPVLHACEFLRSGNGIPPPQTHQQVHRYGNMLIESSRGGMGQAIT